MTISEDLVGKIFLCFVDEADVSRICGVKGTLQNLTLADFVYNISTNDFDLSKLKININGVWCGIDDDRLNISLDDLDINEFHILYANLAECMIVERHDFEPMQDVENDVQSEGEIDNLEVEFVDSDDSVILCNDTDDPVSPHACPGVLKCPTCSMQVCKCIQVDTITEEGIENLIVEPSSDSDSVNNFVAMADSNDDPSLSSTFTHVYQDMDDGPPAPRNFTTAGEENDTRTDEAAFKETPKAATNRNLDGVEKMETPVKNVSLAYIPVIGHIDVAFVDRYCDLFSKAFFGSRSSTFLSPRTLADLGNGSISSKKLPKFGCKEFHDCHLHYLPCLRHYVVTQVVASEEEISLVVYDSNHHATHINEMMEELKCQLRELFAELPKLKICCPQTSLPYSNHALFALANFQVVSQGGDPCHVRFHPEKMRSHLRMIDKETSKPNLLFPFTTLDASLQKENKKFPWMGKVEDYVEIEDIDVSDEEPSHDGLFTTMLTQRHLVSDLEVKNVIKKRQKKKVKGETKKNMG